MAIKKGQRISPTTEFKKGGIPWNKGTKGIMKSNSGTFKKGRASLLKGKTLKDETKEKISNSLKKLYANTTHPRLGKKHTEKAKKMMGLKAIGRIPWNKGKEGMVGKKNPAWLGGKSFEPYGIEFNRKLRKKIRKRDNYRCQECFRHQNELYTKNGKKYKLLVHHIDYNKRNNSENNLISLCMGCHLQTNFSRDEWTGYFKEGVNFE